MCHFWVQNGPFVLNKKILSTSHCHCFHLPNGPFHCAKFKNIIPVDFGAIFGPKMSHFPK